MLISNNGGHQLHVETKKVEVVPDSYHVNIFTTYEHAKLPVDRRTVLSAVLSAAEVQKLKESLSL